MSEEKEVKQIFFEGIMSEFVSVLKDLPTVIESRVVKTIVPQIELFLKPYKDNMVDDLKARLTMADELLMKIADAKKEVDYLLEVNKRSNVLLAIMQEGFLSSFFVHQAIKKMQSREDAVAKLTAQLLETEKKLSIADELLKRKGESNGEVKSS